MLALDWAILALYMAAVVAVGAWAGRKDRDTDDYFLAGRGMPWVMVAMSSVTTALSALTFIGVPGTAFSGDWRYFQLQFGTLLGSYLVARLFLPHFYRLRVATVYELLESRFGPVTRAAATVFFLISRVLASSVRLAGCAIAVSLFFDLTMTQAILLIAGVTTAYTTAGGIRAVIWTDIIQFSMFMTGAVAAVLLIWGWLPGGFSQFLELGLEHGKFRTFNFGFSFTDDTSFWAGNFFSAVLGLAVGATDQDIAQRSLTCAEVGPAQRAAIAYGFSAFVTTTLFLTVGTSLFAYYRVFPNAEIARLAAEKRFDQIFPYFILHQLPTGLRGLLVTALMAMAMGSLDSAINGLASSAYLDLYRRHLRPQEPDELAVRHSRLLVVVFGAVLGGAALLFGRQPSILWFGLRIMGYTYGALLGVFLLAILSARRGREWGNVAAMVSSVPVVIIGTADLGLGLPRVAWPWSVAIGTAWTLGVAALWPASGPAPARALHGAQEA